MMLNLVLERLSEELDALTPRIVEEFPYEDCRTILKNLDPQTAEACGGLIPDLDFYFGEIAGHGSWGRTILEWPDAKIQGVGERLARSFYDWFPVYRAVEREITPSATPRLYRELIDIERTRTTVLRILAEVRDLRGGDAMPT